MHYYPSTTLFRPASPTKESESIEAGHQREQQRLAHDAGLSMQEHAHVAC